MPPFPVRLRQILLPLLTALAVLCAGCAGGRGSAADDPAAVGDIDRILADNPDSASAAELQRMRQGLAGRGRVIEEPKPFDRRTKVVPRRRDRLLIRDPAWPEAPGGSGRLVTDGAPVRLD